MGERGEEDDDDADADDGDGDGNGNGGDGEKSRENDGGGDAVAAESIMGKKTEKTENKTQYETADKENEGENKIATGEPGRGSGVSGIGGDNRGSVCDQVERKEGGGKSRIAKTTKTRRCLNSNSQRDDHSDDHSDASPPPPPPSSPPSSPPPRRPRRRPRPPGGPVRTD
jgi:hypothetical protein